MARSFYRVYPRPFVEGMIISDVPDWEYDPRYSKRAYDAHSRDGVLQRRHGMAIETGSQVTSYQIDGVGRVYFVRRSRAYTFATSNDGTNTLIGFHDGTSWALLASLPLNARYVPRAVYNDEVLFCAKDGIHPMLRWGGSTAQNTTSTNTTWTVGEPTLSRSTMVADSLGGGFLVCTTALSTTLGPDLTLRATYAVAGGAAALESVKPSTANGVWIAQWAVGTAWPGVSIQEKGTYSSAGGTTVTGYGTSWLTRYDSPGYGITWGDTDGLRDAFIGVPDSAGSNAAISTIRSITSDTSMNVTMPSTGGARYKHIIARRCPFTDVTTYKGSLFGIGAAQFRNRVWIGPPGWDLGLPPGAAGTSVPFDPSVSVTVPNYQADDYYLLDYIDVPALLDDDRNVAIYGTPSGVLLLKSSGFFMIRGSYPNFDVQLGVEGAGTTNLLASCQTQHGVFWAGLNGCYFLPNSGGMLNLTEGRIGSFWRSQLNSVTGAGPEIVLGYVAGHLFVFIRSTTGNPDRHLVCDVRDPANPKWQSFFRGMGTPRYMAGVSVPGERDALFYTSDTYAGYILDLAPTISGYKVTNRDTQATAAADDRDPPSLSTGAPRFEVQSGDFATPGDQDRQSRVLDVAISYRYSTGNGITATFSATQDNGTSTSSGSTTLATDASGGLNRSRILRGLEGRQHSVTIAESSAVTSSGSGTCRVEEIAASVRERRSRR